MPTNNLRPQVETGRALRAQRATATATLSTTERALVILAEAGANGLSASILGAKLWPDRTGRASAVQGGGDYAAQMLLGRLRKQGLVRTQWNRPGSSMWEVTPLGMARADIARYAPNTEA